MSSRTHLSCRWLLAAACLIAASATAANVNWDTSTEAGYQSGSGRWGADAYWTADGVALKSWLAGDSATFLGDAQGVVDAITLTANQSVAGLAFGSSGTWGAWTLSGVTLNLTNPLVDVASGSSVVLANAVGGSVGLTKNGGGILSLSGANTYTGNTTVAAGTLRVTGGGRLSTGLLQVSAGANFELNGDSTVQNIDGAGNIVLSSGTLTLNKPSGWDNKFTGTLSGDGALVKTGGGHTFIMGDPTAYTGKINLVAGVLCVTNAMSALGSGDLTISGSSYLNTLSGGSPFLNNRIFVTAGSVTIGQNGATMIFGRDITMSGSANVSFLGSVILAGDLANKGTGAWTLASGATLQLGTGGTSGSIDGGTSFDLRAGNLVFNRYDDLLYSGAFTGTGSLTKSGAGGLTLTGANTYSGKTLVASGTPGSSVGRGLLEVYAGASVVLEGSSTVENIRGDGAILINNCTLTLNKATWFDYFNGKVSGNGALVKDGLGETIITGDTTTYSGSVNLKSGILTVTNSVKALGVGDLTVSGSATLGSISGATPLMDNRIFIFDGTAVFGRNTSVMSFNKDIRLNGSAGLSLVAGKVILNGDLCNQGTGTWTVAPGTTLQLGNGGASGSVEGKAAFSLGGGAHLTFNRSDDLDYSGVFSGSGNFSKDGAGMVTLTGANTYTGATTLTEGTLRVGDGGRLGSGNVTIQGGILDLGSTVYAGAPIYLNAGTVRAQQSLNVAKFAVAASGRIEANLVGTTGLNKTTQGTLILAGANAYTGVTSVSAGKLQVDGTVGKVIVYSGAMVGGRGSLGDTTVNSGGGFAPGVSVGSLSVSRLSLNGGCSVEWQLHQAGSGAGLGYDTTSVSGELNLAGASQANRIKLNLMSLAALGDTSKGKPLDFNATLAQGFRLFSYGSLNLGTNTNISDLFVVDAANFLDQDGNALLSSDFKVINDRVNSQLLLSYQGFMTPIPEPGTYALGVGAVGFAAGWVRRRRRRDACAAQRAL